ncbi:MAG TPA: glycosyltransferase [Candidatus Limnocylindrales bacterium]|nr:glycosyltransferase [Candidatus Limnocylindrales bacterium]
MFQAVDVGVQTLDSYRASAGAEAIDLIRQLATPLRGLRVLHLNATPYGGGVAEILRSEIPLLRDAGLEAEWRIISGDQAFFSVTKAIHNGLQGAVAGVTAEQWERYMTQSMLNARQLQDDYDLVVIHDPQPLAIPSLAGKGGACWIWRCHIDTESPNPDVYARLRPLLAVYDAAVFTMQQFVPPAFPVKRVQIIPPAIDPESPKNLPLDPTLSDRVLRWIGIHPGRSLITQVSRFDPWKDPLGVIRAYHLVCAEVSDCQLALVGSMALDDPEGWEMYGQILDAARDDPTIHVFTNLTGVGNIEVNAFQALSDVVVQKSIREGFGLVVSETLWKGTPVVAGRAGGIPLQLHDGVTGYLVDSVEECARRILDLLRDPIEARAMAQRGRQTVREKFLLTRLLADELRLYAALR